MTTIEKALTRLCPWIKDGTGRELTATIQPSSQGGEILLHWNGDKKKEADKTFQFVDLMRPDRGHPSEWGTWFKVEELKSCIMISPGLSLDQKAIMCKVMERIVLCRQWTESRSDLEWEDFLQSVGRSDLLRLSIDEERDEIRQVREKNEAALQERAERSAQIKKAVPLREIQAKAAPKKAAKKRAPKK